MSEHRWSGWPGAWCLDCGAEDQREVCLASECGVPHVWVPQDDGDPILQPPICLNVPCSEPGSGRHDPYRPVRVSDGVLRSEPVSFDALLRRGLMHDVNAPDDDEEPR